MYTFTTRDNVYNVNIRAEGSIYVTQDTYRFPLNGVRYIKPSISFKNKNLLLTSYTSTNALINGYVKNEFRDEAIKVFKGIDCSKSSTGFEYDEDRAIIVENSNTTTDTIADNVIIIDGTGYIGNTFLMIARNKTTTEKYYLVYLYVTQTEVPDGDYTTVVSTFSIEYYDLEIPKPTENVRICALEGVDYYGFTPIVITNGNRYKIVKSIAERNNPNILWRTFENGMVPTYVYPVNNRFFQFSNLDRNSSTKVSMLQISELSTLVEATADSVMGLPPERVFKGGNITSGNIQIQGDAEGKNAIAIGSTIKATEKSVVIGNPGNNFLQLGNLEFVASEESLKIISRIEPNKAFNLLWKETEGPS
jgi:pentatricopeptide repeat protein